MDWYCVLSTDASDLPSFFTENPEILSPSHAIDQSKGEGIRITMEGGKALVEMKVCDQNADQQKKVYTITMMEHAHVWYEVVATSKEEALVTEERIEVERSVKTDEVVSVVETPNPEFSWSEELKK
jgi:hypothetical protein